MDVIDVIKDGLLQRMGGYEVRRVSTGRTPRPPVGVSGLEASKFWARLVERWLERRGYRLKTLDALHAAEQSGDAGSVYTATLVKYSNKITIKSLEAALELVHRVAAPDVKELCDHCCRHLAAGLSPEQLTLIGDSLEAAIARLDDWARQPTLSDDERDDCRDERGVYRDALGELRSLIDAAAGGSRH